MKRILSILLAICMLLPGISGFAAGENQPGWEMKKGYYYNDDRYLMPYKPADNYYCYQNSPSFTWPVIFGATYELVLANDKELTDIAYRKDNIPNNMYTFDHTLEAGKEYYWAVRYKLNGKTSVWSDPRRLYIDEKAFEYTVPEIQDLGSILKPHPRYFNMEDLAKIDQTTAEFQNLKRNADAVVARGEVDTSQIEINKMHTEMILHIYSKWCAPIYDILNCAYMYAFTGDKKYCDAAIKGFDQVKDMDPAKTFEFNSYTDTTEPIFVFTAAIAYDLLYNDMTDTQRKDTMKLIERNIIRPYDHLAKDGELRASLYESPFDSHAWRLNQMLCGALSIYEDSELARKMVNFHYPMFMNVLVPYVYNDGGSVSGSFYGMPDDYFPAAVLASKTGIGDVTSRALFENLIMQQIYLTPTNWVYSIGDSYNYPAEDTYQLKYVHTMLASIGDMQRRGWALWRLKRITNGRTQHFYQNNPEFYASNAYTNIDSVLPATMQNARFFPDVEWAAMFTDIKDDERVGIMFKSNWYGSHNHAHPDQNSFVIQGYGEELARDSDYYNLYHDDFDVKYNKQTFAHNAITYDNGIGQPYNNILAKGHMTDYVDQRDFRLMSGDASQAYMNGLSKAYRNIIYINPETFIVIDDLQSPGDSATYEYWLNTRGDIGFYDDGSGATITKGKAAMEVKVHYPQKVESNYIDFYAGPDLQEVTPNDAAAAGGDKRLYFQTKKQKATKLVTTLDVHKTDTQVRNIKSENFGDYMKLSFEDGSIVYVNITDADVIETRDDISFSGRAFVYNADSMMLVDGTMATIDGKERIKSDVVVSAAFGKDEISISSIDNDANVTLNMDYVPQKLLKHVDENFYELPESKRLHGTTWKNGESGTEFTLYPGTYNFVTEKKKLPGANGKGELSAVIDGEEQKIPFDGVYDVNNNLVTDYWCGDLKGNYVLNDYSGMTIKNAKKDAIIALGDDTHFYIKSENPTISLTRLDSDNKEVEITDEPKDIEASVDVKVRATDFSSGGEGTGAVWWDRIQNNTLQYFTEKFQTISYTMNVPEDGKYDIIMSVSTVSGETSDKVYRIGDYMGSFNIPPTVVYSDLQAVRVKCGLDLKAGENILEFINLDAGSCIFDWIGLIKSEK